MFHELNEMILIQNLLMPIYIKNKLINSKIQIHYFTERIISRFFMCQISVTLMSWDGWWVDLDFFTTNFFDKVLLDCMKFNRMWIKSILRRSWLISVNFLVVLYQKTNCCKQIQVNSSSISTHQCDRYLIYWWIWCLQSLSISVTSVVEFCGRESTGNRF